MNKLCALLSLFLLLFSCTPLEKKEAFSAYKFEVTENFKTFLLPADVGHLDLYFQSLEDDSFLIFDYKTNQILIYSISKGQLTNTIQFEKEGPQGVGKNVSGVFAKSPTEIYLTAGANTLFKFDSEGNLLQKTTLKTEELEEQGISLFSNIFILGKEGFYFAAFPQVFDWTTLTPEELTQIPNLLHYDSISEKFSPVSYFPKEFVGTNLNKSIFPLLSLGPKGNPVINMNFRNLYRLENGKVISSFAGHSGFPEDPPTSNSPNMFEDMNEIMKIINNVDIYTDLFYFNSLGLMVRVAKFEDIPKNILDTDAFLASKWGLVFLDSEFKKIGEIDLEPDRFHGKYIFANEEGIWISTDHPNSPELKEDFLRFQLIRVEKLN